MALNIAVKQYGAYCCPHGQEQKELLGEPAFAMINDIECDPQGHNSQSQLCKTVGITGDPTWEIQGELYRGRLSSLAASRSVGLYGDGEIFRANAVGIKENR